jgi:hypothetical protein
VRTTNDIFQLWICVVFAMNMNVWCISIGWQLQLSELGLIWWRDIIVIITFFLHQKRIGCTNASMMLGLSMLHNRVLWKRSRGGNPLFFSTMFTFFLRFYNYEWEQMTYFNLSICIFIAMNMNGLCISIGR